MVEKKKLNFLGSILATVHLFIFICFFVFVEVLSEGKEQIQLLWIYWLVLDFPVSIFHLVSVLSGNFSRFSIIVTHGLLGTLWWYYIPTTIKFFQYILKKLIKIK
jgi:hypothetical protein